jgi:hypothetical protein
LFPDFLAEDIESGLLSQTKPLYMPIRTTLLIFLSATLFCGCLQDRAQSPAPTIDLEAGLAFRNANGTCRMHAARQEGSSVKDIRIIWTDPDGKVTTITADTGTLNPAQAPAGSTVSNPDGRSPKGADQQTFMCLTLYNAKCQSRTTTTNMDKLSFNLPVPDNHD